MASDIYLFEGKIGRLTVHAHCCDLDYRNLDNELRAAKLNCQNVSFTEVISGFEVEIGHHNIRRICRLIADGSLPMKYQGGFCSGGYAWGPDEKTTWQRQD